jgi:osmoprotectant transport system permease protein
VGYILNAANWDLTDPTSIPSLFFTHLYITLVSLVIALVIAFPIALLVTRYTRLYTPVLTVSGIIYTIPSLAAFAFLLRFTGLSTPTIVIPLVAYAQVVLIRNFAAAIHAVDPALVEVGRAMGMNGRQLQLRVILPLALPVIVAGIRVTTVTTIGIASLAPLIGVETLGYLVFQGLNFSYIDQTVAGAILITVLAIAADLLLLALQRWLARGQEIAPAS